MERTMERTLDPKKLISTAHKLGEWLNREYADAHLAKVAGEVHAFAEEAVAKAAQIKKPIWLMRIPVGLALAGLLAAAIHHVYNSNLADILAFLDAFKGAAAWAVGAIVILFTLEVRWKRRRALKAIGEIRA